jgi:hypothetical protein
VRGDCEGRCSVWPAGRLTCLELGWSRPACEDGLRVFTSAEALTYGLWCMAGDQRLPAPRGRPGDGETVMSVAIESGGADASSSVTAPCGRMIGGQSGLEQLAV